MLCSQYGYVLQSNVHVRESKYNTNTDDGACVLFLYSLRPVTRGLPRMNVHNLHYCESEILWGARELSYVRVLKICACNMQRNPHGAGS